MEQREAMVTALEEADRVSRETGKCNAWFASCDPEVHAVASFLRVCCECVALRVLHWAQAIEANGFLLATLLRASGYEDAACAELLREGSVMIGELPLSGVGTPVEAERVQAKAPALASVQESNAILLSQLREDELAHDLLRIAQEDANMGRMTAPLELVGEPPVDLLLHPRFAVQQAKPDGSVKVRAVDNFSWSPAETQAGQNMKKIRKLDSVRLCCIACIRARRLCCFSPCVSGERVDLCKREDDPRYAGCVGGSHANACGPPGHGPRVVQGMWARRIFDPPAAAGSACAGRCRQRF